MMSKKGIFEMLIELVDDAIDEIPRVMNRFSTQERTWNNSMRDVRKIKNAPACGDTITKIKHRLRAK